MEMAIASQKSGLTSDTTTRVPFLVPSLVVCSLNSYRLCTQDHDTHQCSQNLFSVFLNGQILAATVDNSKVVLEMDNARLAADDFRMK